ncbi:membrane protein insertase YidC [Alphaproteobacteria bacterium]|nr:membrane protein insertase YidC [Alphaproteobacteria bacterium]
MNLNQDKNLLFAIFAMLAVLGGWHYFYDMPRQEACAKEAALKQQQEGAVIASSQKAASAGVMANQVTAQGQSVPVPIVTTPAAYVQKQGAAIPGDTHRVQIETPHLTGSLNLNGAVFDQLFLKNYRSSTEKNAPLVALWTAEGLTEKTLMDISWQGVAGEVPTMETRWQTNSQKLTPDSPLTLTWQSPNGLVYIRKIAVDADYLFTVEDMVLNQGTVPTSLHAQARLHRIGTPQVSGYAVLHEGPIAHLDHKLHEVNYGDLQTDGFPKKEVTGGWVGFSDQYWLSALIPSQNNQIIPISEKATDDGVDTHTVGYRTMPKTLAPGQQMTVTHHCFGGAKIVTLLDSYEKKLDIEHLDKAVDFGWFYVVTKPIFYCLALLKDLLGNFGLAILVLTILAKILFFPFANKSYRSMGRMRALQPKIKALQERYKDDKMQQHQEMMALYKKEKANPMAGCLPMVVQIPVFFALYKVLFIAIEMRHAPFFGWISDLSAPDPTTLFNLFGLIPWTPPSFLMIGLWPLVMGLTMLWQQKLSPAPADPAQEKAFLIMPVVFTYLFASFPAGLVIYWTWNNLLSICQQWWIMRQMAYASAGSDATATTKK